MIRCLARSTGGRFDGAERVVAPVYVAATRVGALPRYRLRRLGEHAVKGPASAVPGSADRGRRIITDAECFIPAAFPDGGAVAGAVLPGGFGVPGHGALVFVVSVQGLDLPLRVLGLLGAAAAVVVAAAVVLEGAVALTEENTFLYSLP